MLSSALVVFREVFEIVLILGIILAATKNMPNRNKAVWIGLGGGLLGSALVAVFTGKISSYAEGMGQEYFNAGILFTAAAFIGWTVLWMKKNARGMKKHFEAIGHDVAIGKIPFLALSAIIMLTMLREGSEIVLFTYGMLASGQSPLSLVTGSLLGFAGGLTLGLMLYFGLVKLSLKIFFGVTSTMLILLVAGMMSQAFGFLVAAGTFDDTLSKTLWDSSSLLSDQGIIGHSLSTLVGYTARPAAIQFIVYILTLGILAILMKMIDKNLTFSSFFRKGATVSLVLLAAAAITSSAHATKNVTSPYVVKGELELETKTGITQDDDNAEQDGAWQQKASVAYSFTDSVQLEVEGEVENEGDDDNTNFTALSLEGKVQLTEPGQYWLDVGIKGEYEFNTQDGPDEIEAKLLLAKDMGKFTHRANIILSREVGNDSNGDTEAGFAWSSRYKLDPKFEPGFEVHSSFGAINHHEGFDEQDHRAGPVVYGKFGPVKYDVGYLFGLSDNAPDGTFKAILEYERYF